MMKFLAGNTLGKALVDAGIIPPNSGDLIIHVPVAGVVTIHVALIGEENLIDVIKANIVPAQMKIQE